MDPCRCKQMVPARKGEPDEDKPRQCKREIWLDGYCRPHHPDVVARRKADRARWLAEVEERALQRQAEVMLKALALDIETAICLLEAHGYTVLPPSK